MLRRLNGSHGRCCGNVLRKSGCGNGICTNLLGMGSIHGLWVMGHDSRE